MVLGIILHSIDYDELASLAGKRLEMTPLPNVKVIKYAGPKETRDFYEKRCKNLLTDEDLKSVYGLKKENRAWKSKIIKKNKADYMLNLHSSVMSCYDPGDIQMHIFPSRFNTKLTKSLYRYCHETPQEYAQKFIHLPEQTPAKQVLVDILHDPSKLNVDLAASWMVELTAFLNANYVPESPLLDH